ncbi:MAG: ABC transporter ATP-binding protein [Bacillota bacterium]|nr:ABC transporter ATP-binding protein [Bacillota bacterium]
MDESVALVKNLDKNYGNKKVLNGITMTLQKGEIIGLIGPNGAGKTTLIKLLVGLLHPSGGSIKIFNKDLDNLTDRDWQLIAYIADEPNLYEFMTVSGLIEFNRWFYPRWDSERCSSLLQRFHLPPDESVKNLSRGIKTQLAIILARGQGDPAGRKERLSADY